MDYLLPPSVKKPGKTQSAAFVLVRSGTSRLLVFDGRDIRSGEAGRLDVRNLVLGCDGHGGFGGGSLQENKVALVTLDREPGTFRFRFLQVIPKTGAVHSMECSNAAAAAAVFAQLSKHRPRQDTAWKAENVSTRQRIRLEPDLESQKPTAWKVRFLASESHRRALTGIGAGHHIRVGTRPVPVSLVYLGNLFLFADIHPEEMDQARALAIGKAGLTIARRHGFRRSPGYFPKVIPFHVEDDGEHPVVRAASFSMEELHRSMPGSAAMALASFLEARSERSESPRRSVYTVRHRSGSMEIRLGFEGSSPNPAWTEFTTPVCLLGWGVAALPWRTES